MCKGTTKSNMLQVYIFNMCSYEWHRVHRPAYKVFGGVIVKNCVFVKMNNFSRKMTLYILFSIFLYRNV